ncbi:hypothetical protein [Paenibacillus piri]|uniref:galactosylceramidase n=1 Tax=Paenibacillus piri TaxID=2547395 RepID=A0A4R5KSV4_9BACL|nr:hypothetical protein [Paenibacillus piri]TDF98706.1 hypothetical protein E1757_09240 [Paenibacillus piri]
MKMKQTETMGQVEQNEQVGRTIRIDTASGGRTFEGIGGITSNGMSKLLMDYPESVQQEIMELLFKPNYGASLQHLKVEIGSDVNTSCGTEPSHMRSRDDFDIKRGVGLPVAKLAKAIRPDLVLDALRWGTPRWIAHFDDKLSYYLNFLRGARDEYGLEFNYLGPDINEGAFSRDWTVNVLRPGLDRDGFGHVKLVADDSDHGWDIADHAAADEELFAAVHAYGVHYRQDSTDTAKNSGKSLWLSEDLAPFRHRFTSGGLHIAKRMIDMYVSGRMVKYELHPLVEAEYENTPFNYKGILVATWPWSGHYVVDPGLWVIAHFTQFAQIGWSYVDSGCSADEEGGFVTLLAPDGSNFSIVVANTGATEKKYLFELSGEIAVNTAVHVWRTDEQEQFVQQESLACVEGKLQFTAAPYSVYTLTTTTGQCKGTDHLCIPATTGFPLPYADELTAGSECYYPKYTSDQGGAFEVVEVPGEGVCLKQQVTEGQIPIDWTYRKTPEPYTLLGSLEWTNYKVSVEAKVGVASGYISLAGRVHFTDKSSQPPEGYRFVIRPNGEYELWAAKERLVQGRREPFAPDSWHRIELRFDNDDIEVRWDEAEEPLVRIRDCSLPSGQVALASGYHPALFRQLRIEPVSEDPASVSCQRYNDHHPAIQYSEEWAHVEGNFNAYARSVHRSNAVDAVMSFAFKGSSVRLVGTSGEEGGMADVFVDGAYRGTLDAYNRTTGYRKSLFAVHELDPAESHTLKLVVSGKHRSLATDAFVNIDAVEIVGGAGMLE